MKMTNPYENPPRPLRWYINERKRRERKWPKRFVFVCQIVRQHRKRLLYYKGWGLPAHRFVIGYCPTPAHIRGMANSVSAIRGANYEKSLTTIVNDRMMR